MSVASENKESLALWLELFYGITVDPKRVSFTDLQKISRAAEQGYKWEREKGKMRERMSTDGSSRTTKNTDIIPLDSVELANRKRRKGVMVFPGSEALGRQAEIAVFSLLALGHYDYESPLLYLDNNQIRQKLSNNFVVEQKRNVFGIPKNKQYSAKGITVADHIFKNSDALIGLSPKEAMHLLFTGRSPHFEGQQITLTGIAEMVTGKREVLENLVGWADYLWDVGTNAEHLYFDYPTYNYTDRKKAVFHPYDLVYVRNKVVHVAEIENKDEITIDSVERLPTSTCIFLAANSLYPNDREGRIVLEQPERTTGIAQYLPLKAREPVTIKLTPQQVEIGCALIDKGFYFERTKKRK